MFEDFILFHIPFATDVTGNPFWIDIQSVLSEGTVL